MRGLIENQEIRIDDHLWGNREIKSWDDLSKDVHIDKITYSRVEGKRRYVRIRIPINSEKPIKIESKKRNEDIPRILRKEIVKALENRDKRSRFIKEIIDVIKNFHSIMDEKKKIQQVIKRLSKHFELNWTDESIETYYNQALQAYTQLLTDNSGKLYFMTFTHRALKIGQLRSSRLLKISHRHDF